MNISKQLALLTLSAALAACGSDETGGPARDTDSGSNTDSGGDDATADAGADGAADSGGPDAAEPDTTEPDASEPDAAEPDTTEPAGACDNDADLAALATATDLGGTIGDCALGCFSGGATCAADCVQTEVGTSAGCSACFGEVIQCTFNNCALQCISPESASCTTCRDANCTPAFEDCAGIVQP